MQIRYSSTLLGWICEGDIGGRQIVIVSQNMHRAMALYRSLEDAKTVPAQTVYLDRDTSQIRARPITND